MSAPVGPTRCALCSGPCTSVLDGSWEPGEDSPRWLCDQCTRDHARAIEAKLDRSWW